MNSEIRRLQKNYFFSPAKKKIKSQETTQKAFWGAFGPHCIGLYWIVIEYIVLKCIK